MMHHYGKMIMVLTSFLMKRDIISKCLIMVFVFFLLCTVNHVLKTSRLPLCCLADFLFMMSSLLETCGCIFLFV